MATTDKIRRDIEKTKEKISELQKKLRSLETQLVKEENLEIVRMVKAVKMDSKELTMFLRAYASGLISPPEDMMAADSGTGQIVCTPHCTAGDPGMATRVRRIRGAADLMNQILARERIQLQLFPGMEVLCTDRLAEDLADRRLLTLADSRYLLI